MQIDLSLVGERLLLVDDDSNLLMVLKRYMALFYLEADTASNGREATELLAKNDYGVIITDMVMPEMDGMELIQHICEFYPKCDVLVMSGYSGRYSFTDLILAGATDFIAKPFEKDELQAKLQRIFRERQLLSALYQAKKEAEMASQVKSDFLNTISHELRTPMNGILGFSSLLCEVELGEEYADYAKMIRISAERLMDLVNQILNFTNLEVSEQDLHPIVFDLETVIDDLLLLLKPKLVSTGLELQVSIDSNVPEHLVGDANVLGIIIMNLLSNAIKFSEQGDIKIKAIARQLHQDEVVLEIAIHDHGCGIPADKQEDIFKAFTHAESYQTRSYQGAGLGLTICSRLVSLMNGEIWLNSEQEEGSTFTFTVTLGCGATKEECSCLCK